MPPRWVAGVDGCPGGWLAVLKSVDEPTKVRWRILDGFAAVLALREQPALIAVDIPIGLADRAGVGGRACDVEARARLGQRQSSVFAVPARSAVLCPDYREACAVALRHSDPPRKVSKQTFNLFPKIREVDALMSSHLQARVIECHPELAFWALNGCRPLEEPKKVKSRPYAPGLALRRGLLSAAGFPITFLELRDVPATLAGPDDLLDAAACAWSAGRIAQGYGQRFPARPECDAKGLRMEVWC